MNTEIRTISSLKPIGTSEVTGMTVYQSVQFKENGFFYQLGSRDIEGGLRVIESVAEGSGCCLLNAIGVWDTNKNQLICDIPVERDTKYSRQTVVNLVVNHLTKKICEGLGDDVDRTEIYEQVARIIDKAYFEKSRVAAFEWAKRVGII